MFILECNKKIKKHQVDKKNQERKRKKLVLPNCFNNIIFQRYYDTTFRCNNGN